MIDAQLAVLVDRSYSRADFASRMGALRALFEWLFFTVHEEVVTTASLERFREETHALVRDVAFLHALPDTFWNGWTRENVYDQLDRMTVAARQVPVLTLTTAVPFMPAYLEAIGAWARRSVHPQVLLECVTDAAIGAGCQFVWRDHLHDYSFAKAFSGKRQMLSARIALRGKDESRT